MHKETLECKLMQVIGQYGILKFTEQYYLDNGKKFGGKKIVYDVCLEHGEGDIVYSCKKLNEARKWAKEN
jgi:hypothetical protein